MRRYTELENDGCGPFGSTSIPRGAVPKCWLQPAHFDFEHVGGLTALGTFPKRLTRGNQSGSAATGAAWAGYIKQVFVVRRLAAWKLRFLGSGHAAGAFLRSPRISGARRGSRDRCPAFFGGGVM